VQGANAFGAGFADNLVIGEKVLCAERTIAGAAGLYGLLCILAIVGLVELEIVFGTVRHGRFLRVLAPAQSRV
jgi:hypothetical protein